MDSFPLPTLASPVLYSLAFTEDDPNFDMTPTGSFYYDSATGLFSNFEIAFPYKTFDVSNAANSVAAAGCPPQSSGSECLFQYMLMNGFNRWEESKVAAPFSPTGNYFFLTAQPVSGQAPIAQFSVFDIGAPVGPLVGDVGSFTVAAGVTAPEPAPYSFLILALSVAFPLIRRSNKYKTTGTGSISFSRSTSKR